MTENTNQNITVLFVGNPDASAGESILLNINNSPLKLKDLGKTFYEYITSDYYMELIHGNEYISFTYVMHPAKVRSAEANRPGLFWIGVTIPRGKQIENTYDLIISLKNKFQELYMTKLSDGSYEFKNEGCKASDFRGIVDEFNKQLMDLSSDYIEMKGESSGAISLISDDGNDKFETKIKKFLNNTQYEKFKNYSSIITAEEISCSPLIQINVPILIDYRVMHENRELGTINRKKPVFKHTLKKDDFHKDINIEFDLNDFKGSKDILKEDKNDNKYELTKDGNTIIIKPYFKPKEFSVGVTIDSKKIEEKFNISDLLKINKKFDWGWEKDFGRYIIFKGENVNAELELKSDGHIFSKNNENKIEINKDTHTVDIKTVKFNNILITNIPSNDNNKCLKIDIGGNTYEYENIDTHIGGKYTIRLADFNDKNGFFPQPGDIEKCTFESDRYKAESSKITFNKAEGTLTITLGEKQGKENQNSTNSTLTANEKQQEYKRNLHINNNIKNSKLTINEIYLNDDNKNLIEKNIILSSYNKNDNNKNKNDNNKLELLTKNIEQITIKIEQLERNEGTEKNIKPVIKKVKDDDNNKDITINITDNDIHHYTWKDRLSEFIKNILKKKKENTDGQTAETEAAGNSMQTEKSKLDWFWIILAFTLGIVVGTKYGDEFLTKFNESSKRNPNKETSRFSCSRKTKEEEKKSFNNKITTYLTDLKECNNKVNWKYLDDLTKYIKDIEDKNPKPEYINNNSDYDLLKKHLAVFCDVKNKIMEKKFKEISIPNTNYYQVLKSNIEPLINTKDENYKIFVDLINDNTIAFSNSNITSFVSVLDLYNNESTQQEIQQQKNIQNLCGKYYKLMKECDENMTFTDVDDIYKWVKEYEQNSAICNDEKFNTIKKYIPYYKEAADTIRSIDKNWTSVEWFDSKQSQYLHQCYTKNTIWDADDGFPNEFRLNIEYLLGACGTYKLKNNEDALKLNVKTNTNIDKEELEKMVKEINHIVNTESLKEDVNYAKLDKNKYDCVQNLLKNNINSFYDIKEYYNKAKSNNQ